MEGANTSAKNAAEAPYAATGVSDTIAKNAEAEAFASMGESKKCARIAAARKYATITGKGTRVQNVSPTPATFQDARFQVTDLQGLEICKTTCESTTATIQRLSPKTRNLTFIRLWQKLAYNSNTKSICLSAHAGWSLRLLTPISTLPFLSLGA